ncbi:MAG: TetR family transcriptional regulator C-terminal domain-containing protein [Aliidongia sp.]
MTEDQSKPSRQDRASQRRRSLIDAAIAVMAREGILGITMSDIAQEAGCSYGVVSFHFKSKDNLLLSALEFLVEEYDCVLQRALAGAAPNPLRGCSPCSMPISTPASPMPTGSLSGPAFWAEAPRKAGYRERCAELKQRYREVSETLVTELVEGTGAKLDGKSIALGLDAMIDGFWISNQLLGGNGTSGREEAKRACRTYLQAVFPTAFAEVEAPKKGAAQGRLMLGVRLRGGPRDTGAGPPARAPRAESAPPNALTALQPPKFQTAVAPAEPSAPPMNIAVMNTVFSRLRASGRSAKIRCWFETSEAWTPKSSRMTPTISPAGCPTARRSPRKRAPSRRPR